MRSITAEEYTELRGLALIERVGLERIDEHATAICRAMGADVDESIFRYAEEREVTLEEELAVLGAVNDDSAKP